MGWATKHIERLQAGETIFIRPKGHSMTGIISDGQLCKIAPVTEETEVTKGSVVLCKVRGNQYLHLVTALRNDQYQISNNKNHVNGWTNRQNIFGILEEVSD